MRLFIALLLPPPCRQRLARTIEVLRQTGADVKWVEADHLHLTLAFLGNVDATRLNSIQEAMDTAVQGKRPLSLRLVGTGVFPNARRPRVVWVGMRGDVAALAALHGDLSGALDSVGFAPESRAFKAHVTLGRARSDKNVGRLTAQLAATEREDFGALTVDAITLMESVLSARGPTYRPLFAANLRGQPRV